MTIHRQSLLFVLFGGVQVVIDSILFVLLVTLGIPAGWGNVGARASAALVGFTLNGRWNFARGKPLSRFHLMRFAGWWLLTTLVTSVLLEVLFQLWLAEPWQIGVAKVLTEGAVVVLSFFVYRHWVYAP